MREKLCIWLAALMVLCTVNAQTAWAAPAVDDVSAYLLAASDAQSGEKVARLELELQENEIFSVVPYFTHYRNFAGKTFVVRYDGASAVCFDYAVQGGLGRNFEVPVTVGNYTITAMEPGYLEFTMNGIQIPSGKAWTGIASILKFAAKKKTCIFEMYQKNDAGIRGFTAEFAVERGTRSATLDGTYEGGGTIQAAVRNAVGEVVHTEEFSVGAKFSHSFSLPETLPSGKYDVIVTADNALSVHQPFFYDTPPAQGAASITAVAGINTNKITVYGQHSREQKAVMTLVAAAEDGTLVHIGQVQTMADGKYTTSFQMPESAPSGTYTIWVGGQDVANRQMCTVNYTKLLPNEITANVSVEENCVTVAGSISGADRSWATLSLTDRFGNNVYYNQVKTELNGSYLHSFYMPENAEPGMYTLKVGGSYVPMPVVLAFDYSYDSKAITLTADVHVSGEQILVSGSLANIEKNKVTLFVRDGEGNLVYANQTSSELGDFSFVFRLPQDAESGTYTVYVGGQYIDEPIIEIFDYTAPVYEPNTEAMTQEGQAGTGTPPTPAEPDLEETETPMEDGDVQPEQEDGKLQETPGQGTEIGSEAQPTTETIKGESK